ncbi:proliferation-associated 2G4 [Globomyces pollinis-pini]|nr:proliferation-associated 2G4 [Globomyces pollinis-pini]KAJ2998252.1 Proliferation-associated protein 2G4 [Globomyces sp. JEL0801]
MSDHEEEKNENELIPVTVTKYQVAADIANRSLKTVLAAIKPGATILDLCTLGDNTINSISKTVYNKGAVKRGIAFPTCVSPNSLICNLSPLASDPEAKLTLAEGDVVKVELGTHVDGYICQLAHTVVVGATAESPATGVKADIMKCGNACMEAAVRLIKPGNTNTQVTEAIEKITNDFGLKASEGMLSHQLLRNVLDGPKTIVCNPTEQSKKDTAEVTFELGEVYAFDICVSNGDGKSKSAEIRTTVYKRNPNATYQLKMAASRYVFSQVQKEIGTMGFSLRQLDEKKGRMGIIECASHALVTPYGVQKDAEGVYSAHFVFTVLLMPNGPLRLSAHYDESLVKSDKDVKDAEIVELLKTEIKKKKKSAKKSTA